jgi:hypothetical protein
MKISQPERGGNGVRAVVVNQTFPLGSLGCPSIYGRHRARSGANHAGFIHALSRFQTTCCSKSSLGADFRFGL